METTKLPSKGQVIIPKPLRTAHHWQAGQQLVVIDAGDGVLLKPMRPFPETTIDDIAACLRYSGEPKTLDDMEQAIMQGVQEQFRFDTKLVRKAEGLCKCAVSKP